MTKDSTYPNDGTHTPEFFPFEPDDHAYVIEVKKHVRTLLAHPGLPPETIRTFARLLLGLERLPLTTPGLDIHLAFVRNFETAVSSFDLFLETDRFKVECSTLENIGTFDTFSTSDIILEIEQSGYRTNSSESILAVWMEGFAFDDSVKLNIVDLSDDATLDWNNFDGSRYWETLFPDYY